LAFIASFRFQNVKASIQELRAKELKLNRKRKLLSLAMSVANYTVSSGIFSSTPFEARRRDSN